MSDINKYTVEVSNNTITLPGEIITHLKLPVGVSKIDFIIDEDTGDVSVQRASRLSEIKSKCDDVVSKLMSYRDDIDVIVCSTDEVISASDLECIGYVSKKFDEEMKAIEASACRSPRCFQVATVQSVFGNSSMKTIGAIFPIVDNQIIVVGSIVLLDKFIDTVDLYDKLFEQSQYLSEEVSKLSRIVI